MSANTVELTSLNLFLVLFFHFVGDFLLQSTAMATKKSSELPMLLKHSMVYGLSFLWFGVAFSSLMFASHVVIDGVTSGISKKLSQREDKHWFFVFLGFDQMLHLFFIVGIMELV